jgi:hypothetical protein
MAQSRGDSPLAPFLVSLATALISIVPIHSYDAFWHLATGRWIVEHRALPARDPFGLASSAGAWQNGEWLFQLVLYAAHSFGGEIALSLLRAAAVAVLAGWLYQRARRESSAPIALLLVSLAIYGADARLAVRPELAGIVLTAAFTWLALGDLRPRRIAAAALLTILWINLHPSALLAPVIVGAAGAGRIAAGERTRREIGRIGIAFGAALGALLVNPWGWRAVTGPIELARVASSRWFVNTEWLPSDPSVFPLLYVTIAAGAALLAWRRERALIARALLFAIFAVLAVRYVRNHGYFFATLPILLAPAIPKVAPRAMAIAAAATAVIAAIALPLGRGIGAGTDPGRFPVGAVRQLRASGLEGNIYNPDQFGGYLIWQFYPERRVLTDGRNELYLDFLREFPSARSDSRRWKGLLDRYDLVLAVEEYRAGTVRVTDAESGRVEEVSPSHVYFPRKDWALIGFDQVAMVFARRRAFPADALERIEYRAIDPERRAIDRRDPERAAMEIRRAAAGMAGRGTR